MRPSVQTAVLILLGVAAVVISPLAFYANSGYQDSPLQAKTRQLLQSWANCPDIDDTTPAFQAARLEIQQRMYAEGRESIIERLEALELGNELYRRVHNEDDFRYTRERQYLQGALAALSPEDYQAIAHQELLRPSGECATQIEETISLLRRLFFFLMACFIGVLVVMLVRSAPEGGE